ncbi:hypothetical protein TeGR_g8637, partial [Tetraparma gracilis]
MVRCSTPPLRLLALSLGASSAWSEELIDRSLLATERVENQALGTVDYVRRRAPSKKAAKNPNKQPSVVVLRIAPSESPSLILQLGTASPELAVRAALHVARDVAGIDVNMGCPKKFSLAGGMGAALLRDGGKACEIVRALRGEEGLRGKGVSAKIRLVGEDGDGEEKLLAQTQAFMVALYSAGASSICLHPRTASDSSHVPSARARWASLRPLFDCVPIPVLLNGDCYTRADIQSIPALLPSCAGVLLARPALLDPSIFAPAPLPPAELMRRYLRLCRRYDNHFVNTKYVACELMNMRRHPPALGLRPPDFPGGQTVAKVCGTREMDGLCEL